MEHPDKLTLQRFLVGDLSLIMRMKVKCHIKNCPECQAARKKEQVAADKAVDGVISLLEGERMNIEPKALKRHERNAK